MVRNQRTLGITALLIQVLFKVANAALNVLVEVVSVNALFFSSGAPKHHYADGPRFRFGLRFKAALLHCSSKR